MRNDLKAALIERLMATDLVDFRQWATPFLDCDRSHGHAPHAISRIPQPPPDTSLAAPTPVPASSTTAESAECCGKLWSELPFEMDASPLQPVNGQSVAGKLGREIENKRPFRCRPNGAKSQYANGLHLLAGVVTLEPAPKTLKRSASCRLRGGSAGFRMRYSADITAGALKVPESRVIAELMLRGVDENGWQQAIYGQNVLQTRSPKTAKRLRTLIRNRLKSMTADLWRLVRDGTAIEATHACLAATIKHSPILGDFLDLVVREQYGMYAQTLARGVWDPFIEDCRSRDPEMPQWSGSTILRLRSSVFQILAEAGYVESTRTLKLQTVHIARPVLRYLEDHNERYVLRCIQVGP